MRTPKLILISVITCLCAGVLYTFDFDYRTKSFPHTVTYAINLDRSPTRLPLLNKQFDKYNLSYERFPASDGYDIPLRQVRNNKHITGLDLKSFPRGHFANETFEINCTPSLSIVHTDLFLSAGEVGVTCSHIRLWQKIVNSNHEGALIIEDDVILGENFDQKLKNILQKVPLDADFIALGVNIHQKWTLKPLVFLSTFKKMRPNNVNDGVYAYLITQKGAKILLESSKFMSNTIDNFIFNIADKLNVYVIDHSIITHNYDITSEIFEMGRGF